MSIHSDRGADRLMLLDTASLYFRAFYGVPASVTAPDGSPVNAVRGVLDMIARLVTEFRPTRLVACWDDDWRPAFRVAAVPSYKAHRVVDTVSAQPLADGSMPEEVPDLLAPQVPLIVEVLAALGIARVGAAGFEADDVIATLTTKATCPVDIVTGDRDLFQLVDDSRPVRVLYTARGMSRLESVTEDVITAKYGIPGRAYADFALLRGDPSDGLPGVPGIGDKSAASLINTYGDLAGIIRQLRVDTDTPPPDADNVSRLATTATPPLPAGARRKLIDALEYLTVALPVVRVATDIDLPEPSDRLPPAADADALSNLGRRLGLGGSLSRVIAALELDLPAN